MRIQVELTDEDFQRLWLEAHKLGFMRVEPKKAWTVNEKKEAVRFAIARLANLTPDNLREDISERAFSIALRESDRELRRTRDYAQADAVLWATYERALAELLKPYHPSMRGVNRRCSEDFS